MTFINRNIGCIRGYKQLLRFQNRKGILDFNRKHVKNKILKNLLLF